jgi:hypothetical protein
MLQRSPVPAEHTSRGKAANDWQMGDDDLGASPLSCRNRSSDHALIEIG